MSRAAYIICAMLASLVAAHGGQLVANVSKTRIAIEANFSGDHILLFGAIAPASNGAKRHVIAMIEGPRHDVIVHRKERVGGLWVNNRKARLTNVPNYYAIISSAPLAEIAAPDILRHHKIGAQYIIGVGEFARAFTRIKQKQKLYAVQSTHLDIIEERLFRTEIDLPAGITPGVYHIRYFLLENKRVIDRASGIFAVNVVGLEQILYQSAHHHPLLYGIIGVLLACALGWGAARLWGRG